jgi:hypothetical protein
MRPSARCFGRVVTTFAGDAGPKWSLSSWSVTEGTEIDDHTPIFLRLGLSCSS